jgi:lysophospholipase L1-like esterase
VGKTGAARKLASAAAYGGGGLSVLGGALYGVLTAEARLARRTIGRLEGDPPSATGWYGHGRPGPTVDIALIGDSGAAGYGVERVQETPGALLASGIADELDRRVHLRSFALVGAQSADLAEQVTRVRRSPCEVAVIVIGANDVTHSVLPSQSVRYLGEAVRRLVEADVQVVVGTCPDLGTVKPIAPPLRQVARTWSRRLAAAQSIAVVEAGGRTVSLGSILGPEFAAQPAVLFGPDRFHPSAAGYRAMVGALLPSVLAALGAVAEDEHLPQAFRGERVLPVAAAAVQAAKSPGTELDGTEVAGAERGLRGRWVELRHRRRHPQAVVESPTEAADPPGEPGRVTD